MYFADSISPWQIGSHKNTNGLLRWYVPTGTDFSNVTLEQI